MRPKNFTLSCLLGFLSSLVLCGDAGAQVTSFGPFTALPSTIDEWGTGNGSAGGGAGTDQVVLTAESFATDGPSGHFRISNSSMGTISVGAMGATLKVDMVLKGLLDVTAINGFGDHAYVSAEVYVFGQKDNIFLEIDQTVVGQASVNKARSGVICLAPGPNVVAITLTTEATIYDDGNPSPANTNLSDFSPNGLDVKFTEVPASTTYCAAGTSAIGCKALISSTGCASATAPSGFTLDVAGLPGKKQGFFFYSTSGRVAKSWGNGTSFMCMLPPVSRTPLTGGNGAVNKCNGTATIDLNKYWCPTCPKPQKNPGVGSIVQAQYWYRDPQNTSNQTTSLSDAIEFQIGL